MRRAPWFVIAAVALALVAASCGASGDDPDASGEETTTTEADGGGAGGDESAFGDLDDLCGEGDFSVDPDEAGRGTDKLYLAVANDRSAEVRPGLNKVMYDAAVAYAGWCNDQGGIGGLPIEIIDMDAALFNVEAAMTETCSDAFAMVGGGLAQDALLFSGNPGSDFHECGMIDIPGFAVSAEKADSNGQVQPIPNPGSSVENTFFRMAHELYPEETSAWTVQWGELPSLEVQKTKYQAAVADVDGMTDVGAASYPVVGVTDWTPYAQNMVRTGATSFSYVGEVENLVGFLKAARQQGWEGLPMLETNMYDRKLLEAGADADGAIVRMQLHTLEEADEWPAIQKYLDINEQYVQGGEVGALGIQATSAWLLFTTAANACGEQGDGVITRTCILEEAEAVSDWTGGGLHAPQDPARNTEAEAGGCSMVLVVEGGEFVRRYPELGGEGDDVDGFHCAEDGVTEVAEGINNGKVDPDRPI